MKVLEHLRISVRGFSAVRMAYLMVVINGLLLPLHARSDGWGDDYIMGVAFGCTIVSLILARFISRSERHRLLPFLLGIILLMVHGLFVKL